MNRLLVCIFLLLGTPMLCQQPAQNPYPAFPNAHDSPESTAQTDQLEEQSLQDSAEANERIQSNLQSVFDGDPILSGAQVAAAVNDESITLTGTVESYLQHQRVLDLVSPYYRDRMVVDKITVQ